MCAYVHVCNADIIQDNEDNQATHLSMDTLTVMDSRHRFTRLWPYLKQKGQEERNCKWTKTKQDENIPFTTCIMWLISFQQRYHQIFFC